MGFNDPGSGTATHFSDTASTAIKRANFANSCVAFCRKYNFDGVDIDWEYPGDTSRGGNSKDKQNLVLLVQKMRSVFDAANLGLQLTMAIPINNLDSGYNLTALADSLDFFNVMAYDIHGPWDDPQVVGANTDIFAIFDDIQNILNKGVSSNKLVLGLAAYGHTFKLVDSSCTTAGCPFSSEGATGCDGDAGSLAYFLIDDLVQSGTYKSLVFNNLPAPWSS